MGSMRPYASWAYVVAAVAVTRRGGICVSTGISGTLHWVACGLGSGACTVLVALVVV